MPPRTYQVPFIFSCNDCPLLSPEINKSFCYSKENKIPKAQNNKATQKKKRTNHSLKKTPQIEDSLEGPNPSHSNTFGKTLKKNTKNLNCSMENPAERKTLKSKVGLPSKLCANAQFENMEIFEELITQCHELRRECSKDASSEFEKVSCVVFSMIYYF